MPHLVSNYLCITLRLFLILIIFSGLSACSSHLSNRDGNTYHGRIYKVVKGDTLYSIALKYGLYYKELAAINDIDPPYAIYTGQTLRVDAKEVRSTAASPPVARRQSADERSRKGTKKTILATKSPSFYSTPKWQWPAQGKIIALFQGETGLNKGIDLGGKLGEPVLAAASGQVLYAGSGLSGYGKLLIIKHNETFLSAYAHNSELLVKEGDLVKAGQKIADMGSSGTDRVKLHFEIRSDGNPVDPLKFLPKR